MDYSDLTRNFNHADYQYEIIMDKIRNFEEQLDDNHEIALNLASFGTNKTMRVTDIGYHNPNLIFFYGIVDDRESTLIQHVSQLNFLLTSVEKPDPAKPPVRIGFDTTPA